MSSKDKQNKNKIPAKTAKVQSDGRLLHEFTKGLFKENPSLVLLLGLCSTLAVTNKVSNAIGMGISTTFVLICSNCIISALKGFIPDKVRIPAYIVIVASFVTIVEMILNAYISALAKSLGIFIPLIVVNCIILGRAEAFAGKNDVLPSLMDALGMGLGFTMSMLLLAFIREGLSSLGYDFSDYGAGMLSFIGGGDTLVIRGAEVFGGIKILGLPAGALFVFGLILAAINAVKDIIRQSKKNKSNSSKKAAAEVING
jgi:electron transport complex protein RnfE